MAWTYISPAGDLQVEGEHTGAYIPSGEELTLNEAGESIIGYADYSIASAWCASTASGYPYLSERRVRVLVTWASSSLKRKGRHTRPMRIS